MKHQAHISEPIETGDRLVKPDIMEIEATYRQT
jgi:hypothetical protein